MTPQDPSTTRQRYPFAVRALTASLALALVTACNPAPGDDVAPANSVVVSATVSSTTAVSVTTTTETPIAPEPASAETSASTVAVPVTGADTPTTPPAPPVEAPDGGPPGDPAIWPVFICEEVMAVAEQAGIPADACVYVPDQFVTFNYVPDAVGPSGLESIEMTCYTANSNLSAPITSPTFDQLPLEAGGGSFDFAPPSSFWSSCYVQFGSAGPLSDAGLDTVIRLGNAFLNEIS